MIYLKKNIKQEAGATAIEYGLLSTLIAVVTILSLQATGKNLGTTYCTIANKLSQSVGAGSTASGCSANSSGSGSSVNSGTNADGSRPESSKPAGSESPAPASNKPDASHSYSLGDEDNVKTFFGEVSNFGITKMSGFYDSNGNKITTPSQLAALFGTKAEQDFSNEMSAYKTYANNNPGPNAFNFLMASEKASRAFSTDLDNYYSSHSSDSPMFFSDPSSVSFSGSYPWGNESYTTTYSATGISGNHYITGLSGSASNINFNYNAPTGNGK